MDINFGSNKNLNQVAKVKQNPKNIQIQNTSNFTRIDDEVSSISRRLKLLENNVSSIRNSLENLEKNQIDSFKEVRRDVKVLEDENDELKKLTRTLKTTIKKMIDDFQNVAMASDVKVIQNYLDLWNPVKFATPEMVKRIVRDELEEINDLHSNTVEIDKIVKTKQNINSGL